MKKRDSQILLSFVLPTANIILLLGLWQFLSETEIINSALFSSPLEVAATIGAMDGLLLDCAASLLRLLICVSSGYLVGFLIGFLICEIPGMTFLDDFVGLLMAIPGISWAPLFIITIGFGDKTILAVGILTATLPIVYYVRYGIRTIDPNLIKVALSLEYPAWRQWTHVKLPAIATYLLTALALSFARTWRTIIAVEMIAATTHGLGYLIMDSRELLNTSSMYTGILLSGILYYIIEKVIVQSIEKETVVKWGMKQQL